jgi:hypothetical protein
VHRFGGKGTGRGRGGIDEGLGAGTCSEADLLDPGAGRGGGLLLLLLLQIRRDQRNQRAVPTGSEGQDERSLPPPRLAGGGGRNADEKGRTVLITRTGY